MGLGGSVKAIALSDLRVTFGVWRKAGPLPGPEDLLEGDVFDLSGADGQDGHLIEGAGQPMLALPGRQIMARRLLDLEFMTGTGKLVSAGLLDTAPVPVLAVSAPVPREAAELIRVRRPDPEAQPAVLPKTAMAS